GLSVANYPNLSARTNGFAVGSDLAGNNQARGQFEELKTFNYPLDAQTVLDTYNSTRPPTTISGMRLWLRADVGAFTNGSANVTNWSDQSGNALNATNTDSSSQPLYVTNALNGKPVVRFDANNDYLNLPASMSNGVTEAEIYVVIKAATTA